MSAVVIAGAWRICHTIKARNARNASKAKNPKRLKYLFSSFILYTSLIGKKRGSYVPALLLHSSYLCFL